jgi:hypothetical protein
MSCTSTGAISHFTGDGRPVAECVHSSLKERAGVKRGFGLRFLGSRVYVSKGKPYCGRAITLKTDKKLPRILTVAEMQAILDACGRRKARPRLTMVCM